MRRDVDVATGAAVNLLAAGILLVTHTPGLAGGLFGLLLLVSLGGGLYLAARQCGVAWAEALAWTLGLEMALVILAGLLLNMTAFGIQTGSLAVTLMTMNLAMAVVVVLQRRGGWGSFTFSVPRIPVFRPRMRGVLVGAALLSTIGGLWIASRPVPQQPDQAYTLLWSQYSTDSAAPSIRIGIRSYESQPVNYELRIVSGRRTLQDFSLRLDTLEQWQTEVIVPEATGLVQALLYKVDSPNQIYRHTSLQFGL